MTITRTRPRALSHPQRRPASAKVLRALGAVVVLFGAIGASVALGSRTVDLGTVVDALTGFDAGIADHVVIRQLRIPRTILAIIAGASLAVAGTLMQAVTRNPLADPGLLGVNAGAAFAVVLGASTLGAGPVTRVWLALAGALVAAVVVYGLGTVGKGRPSPVRLVLAGAATSALMFSLTRAITLIDQASLEQYRFWVVGSLIGRDMDVVWTVLPFITVGMVAALGISATLNSLALGDDTAKALGVRVGAARATAGLAVMLLAGAAVAAVGPIVFVGLVVPHVVRRLVGPDHRWAIPLSAVAGAALLLLCDTAGRLVLAPGELQAGIVMAAVGGPAFVAVVRRMRGAEL